ncbi:phosphoribosyl-AMP cyclohydrolase [bacterium]|nr:phosphoribosyl-AMP cyclohydrolase [bacterium]
MKIQPPQKNGGDEVFTPKFDAQGLLTAVAVESSTGEILMVAHMNQEALEATRKTRKATFFSRSRNQLWIKGETSGNVLEVEEIRVDCDQDCVILRVHLPAGGVACHTGAKSCFYRRWRLSGSGELEKISS